MNSGDHIATALACRLDPSLELHAALLRPVPRGDTLIPFTPERE
jgi:hypothetical protein